ncbi:FAD binding domain-containing protein [Pisolithus albus]|nr:FAD binding domain-containing protein [Pisolithus albus]
MSSCTVDLKGLVHDDEEAPVNCVQDSVGLGDDVKVKEVMWVSDFRPNVRMVNELGVWMRHVLNFHVTHVCCRPSPDTAHVHSAAGGQGMNSSVQDAFNIAWKIALVYNGLSAASLLDTYTTERLAVIVEMSFTTKLHDRTLDPSDVEHTARSIVGKDDDSKQVESKFESAMRRSAKMYMLGVNYRTSPIVIDEFVPTPTSGVAVVHSTYGDSQEGVLRAGDRAPDAPGLMPVVSRSRASAGSTRMFDIFASTHHTVITFAPALAVPVVRSVLATLDRSVLKELMRRVVVLPGSTSEPDDRVEVSFDVDQTIDAEVLVDHAGHAYRGYIVELQEVKIIIVRPVGVVGATCGVWQGWSDTLRACLGGWDN